jgi:hypothetical protein
MFSRRAELFLLLRLTWTDNSKVETGFVIERSLDATTWTTVGTVGANVISYTDSCLGRRTKYYYRVRAINTKNRPVIYSPFFNRASATTLG